MLSQLSSTVTSSATFKASVASSIAAALSVDASWVTVINVVTQSRRRLLHDGVGAAGVGAEPRSLQAGPYTVVQYKVQPPSYAAYTASQGSLSATLTSPNSAFTLSFINNLAQSLSISSATISATFTAAQLTTTPPPSSGDSSASSSSSSSSSGGAIAGGIIGALVFVAAVGAGVYFYTTKAKEEEMRKKAGANAGSDSVAGDVGPASDPSAATFTIRNPALTTAN